MKVCSEFYLLYMVKKHGAVLSELGGGDLNVISLGVLQWICVTRKYMHFLNWKPVINLKVTGLFGLYYIHVPYIKSIRFHSTNPIKLDIFQLCTFLNTIMPISMWNFMYWDCFGKLDPLRLPSEQYYYLLLKKPPLILTKFFPNMKECGINFQHE